MVCCICVYVLYTISVLTFGEVYTMGCTENEKFSFIGLSEFLVSRREMEDEKREIDFLHFLPIFGQILVIFDDFL